MLSIDYFAFFEKKNHFFDELLFSYTLGIFYLVERPACPSLEYSLYFHCLGSYGVVC
ncbi:hypothetical protein HMPREF0262_01359 [Clostridium sp. ATCC 29733]|nr:hypothetical protein HMPREF0262_01359 [Clostridium sp. ATCC 29733]